MKGLSMATRTIRTGTKLSGAYELEHTWTCLKIPHTRRAEARMNGSSRKRLQPAEKSVLVRSARFLWAKFENGTRKEKKIPFFPKSLFLHPPWWAHRGSTSLACWNTRSICTNVAIQKESVHLKPELSKTSQKAEMWHYHPSILFKLHLIFALAAASSEFCCSIVTIAIYAQKTLLSIHPVVLSISFTLTTALWDRLLIKFPSFAFIFFQISHHSDDLYATISKYWCCHRWWLYHVSSPLPVAKNQDWRPVTEFFAKKAGLSRKTHFFSAAVTDRDSTTAGFFRLQLGVGQTFVALSYRSFDAWREASKLEMREKTLELDF